MKALGMAALAVCMAASASAQLVNGSFESTALGIPGRVNMTLLTDWTSTGGFNLLEHGVNGVSNRAAYDGDQFVSMGHSGQSNSVLEQTFTTQPGELYTVTFYRAIIQGSALLELTARVEDATSLNELGALTVQFDNFPWEMSSFTFTAESDASTLQFIDGSLNTATTNIVLDAVSVVPEPGSLVLVLAGVMLLRRRI